VATLEAGIFGFATFDCILITLRSQLTWFRDGIAIASLALTRAWTYWPRLMWLLHVLDGG
jgi:hypothetical protein